MKSKTPASKTIVTAALIALAAVAGTYFVLNRRPAMERAKGSSGVAVGKPCSLDAAGGDTHGLQCYFYGEVDPQTNVRPSIWIVPDVRRRILGVNGLESSNPYAGYVSGWKKYRSPDAKILFEHPAAWSVNEQNWEKGLLLVGFSQPFEQLVAIKKMEQNAVSIADRIQEIKTDSSTVLEDHFSLNDSEVTRLDIASKNNLLPGTISLFIDRKSYYIEVSASRFDDPFYDFPIEYLLNTLTVK